MTPVFGHGRLRLYLLKLLDEAPRHGYEVIRLLQDRFLGVYSPSPGTIYPRLSRLEEEGLVTHDEVDGKKVYRITEKGRQELRDRMAELTALEEDLAASVREIAQEIGRDVRETVRGLREEIGRAARAAAQGSGPGQAPGPGPGPGQEAGSGGGARKRGADWARFTQADRGHGWDRGWAGRQGPGQDDWNPGQDDWDPGRGARKDAGPWPDLERIAAQFASDIQAAASRATAGLDENVLSNLRGVLADALTKIRTEVFEPGQAPGKPRQEPPPRDQP